MLTLEKAFADVSNADFASKSATTEMRYKTCSFILTGQENNYLNLFDKVIVTYDGRHDYGNKILKIRSLNFINSSSTVYESISVLWRAINEFFTPQTIEEYQLQENNLLPLLRSYQDKFPSFTTNVNEVQFFRIEEERENDRIILSVDPPTGLLRLCLSRPSSEGIHTLPQLYFATVYDWSAYHQVIKSDYLNFMEQLEFDKWPKSLNNQQVFEIQYGVNLQADPITKLGRSFYRQRKYTGDFIDVCNLYAVQDSFGVLIP